MSRYLRKRLSRCVSEEGVSECINCMRVSICVSYLQAVRNYLLGQGDFPRHLMDCLA